MSVRAKITDNQKSTHKKDEIRKSWNLFRNDQTFKNACAKESVEPTQRQARAYLAKRGRWKNR